MPDLKNTPIIAQGQRSIVHPYDAFRRWRSVAFYGVLVAVFVLSGGVIHAQDDQTDNIDGDAYPTLKALVNTVVPAADSIEIAANLFGVRDVVVEPQPQPALGDVDTFNISNSAANISFDIEARLVAIGEHIYIWVQAGVGVDEAALRELARKFDDDVYDQVRDLWGSEAIPGIDGDPRVHAVFAGDLGFGTGAYFARRHTFPDEVLPGSNEREMFVVNLDAYSGILGSDTVASTLAHEFQHMIRSNVDRNEDTWMDEGFATFTQSYLGYPMQGMAQGFLAGTQLNTFGLGGTPRGSNYAAGFMFMNYFYDRYGIEAMRLLSADPANGLQAVDNTLVAQEEPGVDVLFADWVLANLLNDPATGYGYSFTWPIGVFVSTTHERFPTLEQTRSSQYATNYSVLNVLPEDRRIDVRIEMPTTTRLVATEAYSGDFMWYSNRGDVSHTTLTRAFDLSGVERATLHFWTWYEIEEFWDYGYLTVSTDAGQSWDIIAAPGTTTENPQGNAYGPGYTGYGNTWQEISVPLDAYAGSEILLRFEMITDDAVTEAGMVIDDISVPEIGYFDDFESGAGGWQTEGWLLIDNRLPQQAWVQFVEYDANGDFITVTRYRATPEARAWTLSLDEATDWLVFAVSPFAPVTTIETGYTLHLE